MSESVDFVSDPLRNPISASRRGQEALQDLLSGLRDLMLSFFAHMDPKKRNLQSTQALSAAHQCLETIEQMKSNRELLRQTFLIVKEHCNRLPETDPAAMLPYVGSSSPVLDDRVRDDLNALNDTREHVIKRYLEVTAELHKVRQALTGALWDLNDLMDPTIVNQ
ncbi:uncharacterized protein DEA37_0006299 [Paragonimus westermani]|uniref:Mediator of RNA polymerase II transcription subunit 30 n=1 Tax=Paragonimus westermani TaxID=34504 RepID=A0A5J4N621_9TREM|nr:uncharacterized protein DEA37_0006299 [Paragonimus westermani]